jgi:hypothetical protein
VAASAKALDVAPAALLLATSEYERNDQGSPTHEEKAPILAEIGGEVAGLGEH